VKRVIIIVLSISIIWGCTTNKQYSLMEPTEGNALVTGVMQVYFNGDCVTSQASILFNEDALENVPYQLDYDGRFTCQLPLGSNYISKIYYQNVCLKLPIDLTCFDLSEENKILYLGDLSVDWQHDNFQSAMVTTAAILTGVIGGLIVWGLTEALSEDHKHQLLYAEKNLDEARDYLSSNYDNQLELTDRTFDFPNPGKYFEPKQPVDHSLNPDFLTFNTYNNKVCYGNLRYLKKKKIYVQCENIIYVIPKNNLKAITNHAGQAITLDSFSRKTYQPLNYDSYEFKSL